jgi:hypothetical protein
VPGNSCAHLVRALHNTIVFAVRHFASLRRLRNGSRSRKQRRPPAAVPLLAASCPDANVECAQTLPEQRHAVKTIFLGILTYHSIMPGRRRRRGRSWWSGAGRPAAS